MPERQKIQVTFAKDGIIASKETMIGTPHEVQKMATAAMEQHGANGYFMNSVGEPFLKLTAGHVD